MSRLSDCFGSRRCRGRSFFIWSHGDLDIPAADIVQIWRYCKLLSLGPDIGPDLSAIRFVVAASYGLGRSGSPISSPMSSPTTTPISPTPEMIVSVHPRPGCACLALSSGEFDELWDSFVETQGLLFLLPHVIKEAIYEKCGHQVDVTGPVRSSPIVFRSLFMTLCRKQ